jgi:hypothetical protein
MAATSSPPFEGRASPPSSLVQTKLRWSARCVCVLHGWTSLHGLSRERRYRKDKYRQRPAVAGSSSLNLAPSGAKSGRIFRAAH